MRVPLPPYFLLMCGMEAGFEVADLLLYAELAEDPFVY